MPVQSTGSSVFGCSGTALASGADDVVVEVVTGVDEVVVGSAVVEVGELVVVVGAAGDVVLASLVLGEPASLVLDVVDVLAVLVGEVLGVIAVLDEVEEELLSDSGVVELHAERASVADAMAVRTVLMRLFICSPSDDDPVVD